MGSNQKKVQQVYINNWVPSPFKKITFKMYFTNTKQTNSWNHESKTYLFRYIEEYIFIKYYLAANACKVYLILGHLSYSTSPPMHNYKVLYKKAQGLILLYIWWPEARRIPPGLTLPRYFDWTPRNLPFLLHFLTFKLLVSQMLFILKLGLYPSSMYMIFLHIWLTQRLL